MSNIEETNNNEPRYSVDLDRADVMQLKEKEVEQNTDQKEQSDQSTGSFEEQINKVLDQIRPNIRMDGGDVQLIESNEKEGSVKLRLIGACRSCHMSDATLKGFIEMVLKKKVPEVKLVESI